ncbi:hypothetical protein TNCV_2303241 [Trichonephila clavipes]|nr:hypothetical protein TNCV_2303241 [Trichonephila clavipes]
MQKFVCSGVEKDTGRLRIGRGHMNHAEPNSVLMEDVESVFTVRFHPHPGRGPSLLRSLKRQIASNTVCRDAFSKRTVISLAQTTLK